MDKVMKLVGGGSVINRAYPTYKVRQMKTLFRENSCYYSCLQLVLFLYVLNILGPET